MIHRIGGCALSFRANEISSGRSAYNSQINKNTKTAQMQNNKTSQAPQNAGKKQIPMHGQVQNSQSKKLDVVA